MQPKNLFSACLFGVAVSALPSGKSGRGSGFKAVHVDANFDDLTAAPLDVEAVGDYDYLYYQGFSVGSEEVAGVQIFGVTPHTSPNVAYSDPISDTFAGPALVADYDGSKTKAFDLKSFYYACIDISETPVATAENCTVTVTGYRGDTQVATQDFTYGGDDVLGADLDATMTLATLSTDFTLLTEVDITYTQTNTIDSPPAFIGDDFVYTAYVQGKGGKGVKGKGIWPIA